MLKVTTRCPCKGLLCSVFSPFGFYIALDGNLTRFHGKKANGGSKGDGALSCKGLLCLIFFALVLILLWTGKRCDLCLIPTRFHAKKG
ncbi:hypothetical protein GLYMA_18G069600v4 [Glycine max]|uniref:Uncharacterized protein n=1 Tax=Glycine max TaxID=3847 RepID=A0A0R0F7C8_SOYBN|nr:hypothetical protein GYH30_049280 [Glycine max]KRG98376.1 hypothetical protein GLYMA_18G069600v4 [Glycine max]